VKRQRVRRLPRPPAVAAAPVVRNAGRTLVRDCRPGDQVGNANRVLYTFLSAPVAVVTSSGVVAAAQLAIAATDDRPGDVETRIWLHPDVAAVHVRAASLADFGKAA
jgi:hypothetical protein